MNFAESIEKALEKIRAFLIKTNARYDKIEEPNRFFTAMAIIGIPILILPGGWMFVWMIIAIAWRISGRWWKAPSGW